MKEIFHFIIIIFLGFLQASGQVTGITVETYYSGGATPSVTNYPANHNTYRIYANTVLATDRVTTVSGDMLTPLSLSVSGSGIWNYQVGGATGDAASCLIYASQPLSEYDSYMTIGVSCNNDGASNPIYRAEDASQPWQNQAFSTAPHGNGDFVVNSAQGAAWFALTDNPNCAAGADLKVLLAQITTDGDICGTFNLQVFPNYAGAGSAMVQQTFAFASNAVCVPGCTDPAATNFNPSATYDNGLCLFPCSLAITSYQIIDDCVAEDEGAIVLNLSGNQSFLSYSVNGVDYGLTDNYNTPQILDQRFS